MLKQSSSSTGALLLCVFLHSTGMAQGVPPANSKTRDNEDSTKSETIQLSPFEVNTSQDVGYVAASSLTGGRTDTELRFTPAAISVMTSEFLDDIGATNLRGSLEWSLNYVVSSEVNTTGLGGFSNTFRNMGSTFATRNFFLWYVESDSYNTERYEFARGPNGVLFGDGGAGGIATTWTKRPRFGRTFRTVNFRADTYGGWRGSIDLNQPAGDRFALRLNAMKENAPAWRDYTHNERHGVHLAGVVRLSSRNNFRFEGEVGGHDRSIYANYIIDQVSNWNRVTNYDGTTPPSTSGTGVARIASTPWMLYIPGTPNGGFNDWSTFYQTTGSGLGLMPNAEIRSDIANSPAPPPKGFNYTPTDIVGTLRYHAYTFYLDHRFSDNLFVEIAYNRLRNIRNANGQSGNNSYNLYRVDVNRTLPGGGENPNFGKAFTDTQPILLLGENWVNDYRGLANWRYQNKWFHGSASVIVGSRPERYHAFTKLLRRNNGPVANLADASNQVRVRRYWDQAGDPLGEIPVPGSFYDTTSEAHQRKQIDYGQIATVTQFFNDKLTILVGARRDHYEQEQLNLGSTVPLITDVSTNSKNYGAVYYVVPWLGLFANYSETFQAPNSGDALIDGSPPGISRGKGKDYGIKLQLLDGKIAGTFSYYDTEQAGRLQNGGNLTQINRLWTNLGRPTIAAFRDTNDLAGTGYEFELTANLTRGLRFTANLALPKSSNVNLEPGLRGYVAANIAAWQAGANDPSNPAQLQMQTDLSTITSRLESLATGALTNGTYEYTGNFYAAYQFFNGPLKGFTLGGGANFRGPQKIGNVPGNPFDYLRSRGYYLVSGQLTYRRRFSEKLTGRFQINVSNLLNSDVPIFNGYTSLRPSTIRIPDPRKVQFSTTLEF